MRAGAEDARNPERRWRHGTTAFLEGLLIAVALIAAVIGANRPVLRDSANSRLASAWSLVHAGTWRVDESPGGVQNPFAGGSVDFIEIDGRRLSTKPPLLPLAMAAEYGLLHHGVGWDLGGADQRRDIVFCMVLSLVILPYLLGLFCFTRLLRWLEAPDLGRVYLLAALAFGTLLPGYAATLNNHVPAAGITLAGVYLAFGLTSGNLAPRWWRFALFGLAAAAVFALDMPMTIYVALAGLHLTWRFPRQAFLCAGPAAAALLALHFGIMGTVTGSLLPIQMRKELYLHEASYWRNPMGLDAFNEPKLTYLFHMTLGRFGTFLLFPVVVLGPIAAFRRSPGRGYLLGALAGFVILTAYYVFNTNNYGGSAYGFRWHLGSMPLLLLMSAPLVGALRKPVHWLVPMLLLAVSCYSAWECFKMPWGDQHEWTCRVLFGRLY